MGAACCISSRNGNVNNRSPGATIQRHSRHSPSWSFRWDNRGRVAGEDTTVDWLRHGGVENDHMEVKSRTTVEATCASDDGSPLDSFRALTWQKSPVEGSGRNSTLHFSDPAASCDLVEVKESVSLPSASYPSPVKLSPPVRSVSSASASPLSSQSHFLPRNATPSRWHHRSPVHPFLREIPDSRILEYRSPTFPISEEPSPFHLPVWGGASSEGSSSRWSIPALSDFTTGHKERWSFDFDSETSSLGRCRFARNSGRKAGSSSELQSCFICSKLLMERPSWRWSTQKMISSSEIAVVAVLTCGHVYHGECLEYMTPEINKYDPICPVCTLSEKKAAKMPRIDVSSDSLESGVLDGIRTPKISSSSGTKNSTGKPFLRHHFSFGSRASRPMSVNHQSTSRKGFFWAKCSKY